MRVIVREGGTVLADLSFEEQEVCVGSEAACNIHLPNSRVSPRNVLLAPTDEGKWQVENIDPDNKVMLNNHVLTERTTLQDDDEILIQDYMLRVYVDSKFERQVFAEEPQLGAEELAEIRKYPLPSGSIVRRYFDPFNLTREQLERIARLNVDLATSRDIHELVDISLNVLLEVFAARAAWIGLRRQKGGELEVLAGRLASGLTCETNPLIDLLQYRCVERSQHICVRRVKDQPEIGSALAVPLIMARSTLGMIYVDRPRRARRFEIPDLDLITVIAAHISAKVEAVFAGRLQRDAEVLAAEISVAHSIQAQLDPKFSPVFKNLQLAAYSRSGQEKPGDVYDMMKHPDTEVTAFLVGHANATGASLPLSMARLHSTFRVAVLHNDPPHAFLRELNWLIYDETDPSTIDGICLLVDPVSGKIKYSRAGKLGAMIVNARGEPRPLQGVDAPPMGQRRSFEYTSWMEQLAPGETLALYSRGVATAMNAEGERFGENRFIELVCDGFCQPPANTIQDLSSELTAHFADGKCPDDITIVLLHRTE